MKHTLLVCYSFALLMTPVIGQEQEAIEGQIRYLGAVPKSRVADNAGQRREILSVDRRSKGLQDVVIYLDLPKDRLGRVRERVAKSVTIDQLEHRFTPHVVAIRSGDQVVFTNSDAANHNVRAASFEDRNNFNTFTGAGGEYKHTFYATRHPVKLGCDIHPWMSAWVFVFEHPFYAVSDKKGKFRIADVPPGEYEAIVQQPDVGYRRRVKFTVQADQVTQVNWEIREDELKLTP